MFHPVIGTESLVESRNIFLIYF